MRAQTLIGTGLWLVAWVAWPAASAEAQSDVTAGAKVYAETCGRCHNPRSPTERTDREWTVIMTHMRVRGGLPGKEARQVLAFLQANNGVPSLASLEGLAAAPSAPGTGVVAGPAVQDGGAAIVESKGCRGCHVIGKAGGNLGPSLNGVIGRRGDDYVRQKLQNPAFDNANTLMPKLGLTEAEIQAIVDYLKSLSP